MIVWCIVMETYCTPENKHKALLSGEFSLRVVVHLLVTKSSWGKLCNGDGAGLQSVCLMHVSRYCLNIISDSLCVRVSVCVHA